MEDKPILSLSELREWMRERGVTRSRKWFEKTALEEGWPKIGTQYAITISEAQVQLERLKGQDS